MGAEATPTPLDLDDEVDALPNSWKPFGNRFQLAVVFFLGFLFGTALKLANSRQQLLLFTPPTTKVLDRPIVDGRPWPRDPELSTTGCQQMDTFAVALVSSLDTKYQDLARSALDSWGQYFPHKLIFVMGEVNSTSVPDAELRALTRDGFDGVDIQKITLEVSSGENNKPYIWKLAQHLFVEAAKRIMLAFPDVQYYVMVDADTTLRPHCLGNLLDFFPHNQVRGCRRRIELHLEISYHLINVKSFKERNSSFFSVILEQQIGAHGVWKSAFNTEWPNAVRWRWKYLECRCC